MFIYQKNKKAPFGGAHPAELDCLSFCQPDGWEHLEQSAKDLPLNLDISIKFSVKQELSTDE